MHHTICALAELLVFLLCRSFMRMYQRRTNHQLLCRLMHLTRLALSLVTVFAGIQLGDCFCNYHILLVICRRHQMYIGFRGWTCDHEIVDLTPGGSRPLMTGQVADTCLCHQDFHIVWHSSAMLTVLQHMLAEYQHQSTFHMALERRTLLLAIVLTTQLPPNWDAQRCAGNDKIIKSRWQLHLCW